LVNITNKETKNLLKKQNVVGVGEGTKYSRGVDTGEACIIVLVREKKSLSVMHSGDRIPKTLGIRKKVKTDVVEIGDIEPLVQSEHQQEHCPLVGGISCAPKGFGFSGTIGLPLVYQDNQPMMLSNVHVIAPHWQNDNLTEEEIQEKGIYVGTPILHPSTQDRPWSPNDVGNLHDWVPISTEEDNLFDAAIANVTIDAIPELLGLGTYSKIAEPKNGMKVRKSGRTSDVTESVITVSNLTIGVTYPGLGVATFTEQLGFSPALVSPGDSGSVVINEDGDVVALAFAGGEKFSVATPIQPIFEHYDLKMEKSEEVTVVEEIVEESQPVEEVIEVVEEEIEEIIEMPEDEIQPEEVIEPEPVEETQPEEPEEPEEMEKELEQLEQTRNIVVEAFKIVKLIIQAIGRLFPSKK
jgi:hypothetical protein